MQIGDAEEKKLRHAQQEGASEKRASPVSGAQANGDGVGTWLVSFFASPYSCQIISFCVCFRVC